MKFATLSIARTAVAVSLLWGMTGRCCWADSSDVATVRTTHPFPVLPEPVTSFGAAIIGSDLYLYGGHRGGAHHYHREAQANTLWRLKLGTPSTWDAEKPGSDAKLGSDAKWERLSDGPRLQGLAMVAANGKLYRLSGFEARNKEAEEQDLWSLAGAAEYDPATGRWTELPPLPEPRSSFDAAVLDGAIYVVGGWQMRGEQATVWRQLAYRLDLTQPRDQWRWQPLPAPPFQRRALAVAAYDGRLYAIGGMQPSGKTTTRVDVYDPASKLWQSGPALLGKPLDGFGASAFASGGHLYVTTLSGQLQRLSEDGEAWELAGKLEQDRFFHRMLPLPGGKLLSVGGASMQTGKTEQLDVIHPPPATQPVAAPAAVGWTSFQNGGHIVAAGPCPANWSPTRGLAWQQKLAGYGQSSPVAAAGQIYVTSQAGKQKEQLLVQALQLDTGKELWRHELKNSSPEESTNYVSRAAPTPVCHAGGVIALFEGGNLVSLDKDGQVRWERDLVADYGPIKSRHGIGASLEQDEHRLFVWIERESDPYVAALDKDSGKTIWKSAGIGKTCWSSPRLAPIGGLTHLVLSGAGAVVGYDPENGKELWRFNDVSGNTTATPVSVGDGRLLIGASEGRGEEAGAGSTNGVLEVRPIDGGGFQPTWLWKAGKASSSFGSPVVHDGLAYFVNRVGVVFCLDATTGEELYASRSAGSIWATPIVSNDLLYLFGKDGRTTVIKTGRKHEQVAVNSLWDGANAQTDRMGFGGPVLYAAIAPGDGSLLLRRGDILYRVAAESGR
ncbi:MAG: DUF1668 domain-containing protein [Planctomycetales bacterium]|nr:DUF1668 domain-containing protein [Planctomycetales bacterium]